MSFICIFSRGLHPIGSRIDATCVDLAAYVLRNRSCVLEKPISSLGITNCMFVSLEEVVGVKTPTAGGEKLCLTRGYPCTAVRGLHIDAVLMI